MGLENRDTNNFDQIRLAAAFGVLVSHSWPLFGHAKLPEPFHWLAGRESLGFLSVAIFFFVSGYLNLLSLQRSHSPIQFGISRAIRIFPGLIANVMFCIFVVGWMVTTTSSAEYFSDAKTLAFFRNMILFPIQFSLPGVFESNPFPNSVNGSLWTLPIELTMYASLAIVFFVVRFSSVAYFAICVAIIIMLLQGETHWGLGWSNQGFSILPAVTLWQYLRLGAFFWLGAVYAACRGRIPVNGRIALFALAVWFGTFHTPYLFIGCVVAIPYLIFWLAQLKHRWVSKVRPTWDVSYGVYLYAFPIQQITASYALPIVGFAWSMVVAALVTTVLACLSFILIERPSIRSGRIIVAKIAGGRYA